MIVTTPQGVSEKKVIELVASKVDWIFARIQQFEGIRYLLGEANAACSQAFDLPAIAESWRVEYKETCSKNVGARTDKPGRVIVFGAINDAERCKAAFCRWLARRAKDTLEPWISSVSKETGLKFSKLMIKSQRSRWGSCSSDNVISLNSKLLFLTKELVRYVMLHDV